MTGSFILLVSLAAILTVAVLVLGIALSSSSRRSEEQTRLLSEVGREVTVARAKSEEAGKSLSELSRAVELRLSSFEKTIDGRIEHNHSVLGQNLATMQKQSAASAELLKSVGENLGRVFEASQKIEKLAGDVTRLEDLLKPPKIRGLLGEKFLEEALRQVMPSGSYEMQKRFADGEAVDAAIVVGSRFVPVDSKFPLENYRKATESADENDRRRARREFGRDVRKHVDAIAAKYIRPAEGSYEFALMYVPAEAVYAEIVIDTEDGAPADYAVANKVIPVSPRLLYAYLSTIAQGLKGLEINRHAQEIQTELSSLKRSVGKVEEPFGKLGGHLSNAQKQFDETRTQLSRFADQLRKIDETENAEPAIAVLPPDS